MKLGSKNETNLPKVDSSEVVFKHNQIVVRRDKLLFKDGSSTEYTYINLPGGVVILPLNDDGTITMIQQFRYLVGRRCWELPAGGIKKGEAPESAAGRELQEEVGLRAKELIKMGFFYPSNGLTNEIVHVYLAKGLIKTSQRLDSTETDVTVVNVPAEAALEMVWQNRILGSSSIIALLTFYFHWRQL